MTKLKSLNCGVWTASRWWTRPCAGSGAPQPRGHRSSCMKTLPGLVLCTASRGCSPTFSHILYSGLHKCASLSSVICCNKLVLGNLLLVAAGQKHRWPWRLSICIQNVDECYGTEPLTCGSWLTPGCVRIELDCESPCCCQRRIDWSEGNLHNWFSPYTVSSVKAKIQHSLS